MPSNQDEKPVAGGQPRDIKGQFDTWGLAGDGIDEATEAFAEAVQTGTTAPVEETAWRLVGTIRRVPTLTPGEAEAIAQTMKQPGADPVPTGLWLELHRACRNSSTSEDDWRGSTNKRRLNARIDRDRRAIQ